MERKPELIKLTLLSVIISLSSGKGEQVGVIPQLGRMEVSKVVIRKSLSCPLCVSMSIYLSLVLIHKQTVESAGQSCSVANKSNCLARTPYISAKMAEVRHEFFHSAGSYGLHITLGWVLGL